MWKKCGMLFAAMLAAVALYADANKIEIPVNAKQSFTLPGMTPDAENDVVLTFDARSRGTQGWSCSAVLNVNGVNLNWAGADKRPRMLDRGVRLYRKDKPSAQSFFRGVPKTDKVALLIFVGKPTDTVADKRAYGNELGFVYRLNISDLVKASGNELVIENVGIAPLLVSDVKLVKVSKAEVAEATGLRQGKLTPYSPAVKTPAYFAQVGTAQTVDVPPKGNVTLNFPAVEIPADKALVLGMNNRLLKDNLSGWSYYLSLAVNNQKLGAATAAKTPRLLARGAVLKMDKKGTLVNEAWFNYGRFIAFFAPCYESELDARIKEHREAGYDFYFDLSDCVKSGEAVQVTLGNTEPNCHMGAREVRLLLVDKAKLPELQK